MAYELGFSLALGGSYTGTALAAQIYDTSGGDVGGIITSGFSELGNGYYYWYYASFSDAFRGGVKFFATGTSTPLAHAAINPEEVENADVKTSTRSTLTQADILSDTTPFAGANIDTTVSSRSDFDNTSDQVIVTTNNDKTGYALSAASVDDVFDEVYEGTRTLREWLRLAAAVLFNKSTGGGTTTGTFRDDADSKARVTATLDANGNRTNITLDDS